MSEPKLNLNAIAKALEEASEALARAGAAFLGEREDSGASSGDAGAGKRGAGKSASKSKEAEASDDEVTIDDVREALQALLAAKGKDKMVEALETVGAGKLADVDESQYAELKATAEKMAAEEDEAPKGKKAAAKSKKGPSLEDLTEAFKELLEADTDKAKAVLKKFKLKRLSEAEEGQYADILAAVKEASEEEPGDDDLL